MNKILFESLQHKGVKEEPYDQMSYSFLNDSSNA